MFRNRDHSCPLVSLALSDVALTGIRTDTLRDVQGYPAKDATLVVRVENATKHHRKHHHN